MAATDDDNVVALLAAFHRENLRNLFGSLIRHFAVQVKVGHRATVK
jgi:hypothetical protein